MSRRPSTAPSFRVGAIKTQLCLKLATNNVFLKQVQMELIHDRMADMERRRVSLDDVKKMFKQRIQRDIDQTEADLGNWLCHFFICNFYVQHLQL